MIVKCFIIEGDPLTVKILRSYIAKTPFLSFSGLARSFQDFSNYEEVHDILLVSAELDCLKDEELIELKKSSSILILMSKTIDILDYSITSDHINRFFGLLKKPVDYESFLKEIERVIP